MPRSTVRRPCLLHAVGVDASFFDAIAVLIALVALAQLPVGSSVGAAAAVLILGSDGVAAAAAAGVLAASRPKRNFLPRLPVAPSVRSE